jgi:hypothetical protein
MVGTAAEDTCTESYINLDTTNYTPSRRCGEFLSSMDLQTVAGTVTDTEAPFDLYTFSTFPIATIVAAGGYKIDYTQVPC